MQQNTVHTIPELCELIWELEERHNLLDLEISGVKVWQACRMQIYYRLAEQCGLYEPPHVAGKRGSHWLLRVSRFFRNLTVDNPFLGVKPRDIAVFDHNRSNVMDGKTVDIYSYSLCKELQRSNESFIVFERPFLYEYVKDHDFERCRVGAIDSLSSVLANIPYPRMGAEALITLRNLESDILSATGVKPGLEKLVQKQIRRFKLRRYLYSRLLQKYAVKKLYLVVSYYLAPLIDAAKALGIPVAEIQHGVINQYHLGYSFPGRRPGSLDYFPDSLLLWGGNWPTTQHLPLADESKIEHGFRFFEANKVQYASISKKPGTALIVSQSVHGDGLAKFILENLDRFDGLRLSYKLHPSEFNRRETYEHLALLESRCASIEVIEGGDVHHLLAESEMVIGVFSTVLFEALEYQCQVYVCPLSGWEYMGEMLETGKMRPFANLGAP